MRALLLLGFLVLSALPAQDVYYTIPWEAITVLEGAPLPPSSPEPPGFEPMAQWANPWVDLDGPGEAWVSGDARWSEWHGWRPGGPRVIHVKAPGGGPVMGYVAWVGSGGAGRGHFRVVEPDLEGAAGFRAAKAEALDALMESGAPGAAWFRHEYSSVAEADVNRDGWFRGRQPLPDETLSLFTGGRALSENLQLSRDLPPATDDDPSQSDAVAVDGIRGITTKALDWTTLLEGIEPVTDSVAAAVPEDQHVLLFPSVGALCAILDAADRAGTPILHGFEERAEDAGTRSRYERQLGVSMDELRLLIGSPADGRLAITGSDPYLRTGSDIALIFQASDPKALAELIRGRRKVRVESSTLSGVVVDSGEILGVGYDGLANPTREVSSYLAATDDAVILTNSRWQLERVLGTVKGGRPSLAALPEFTWFRHRYAPGDPEETGFLFISDPTIRRWCSARWRIGNARRIQAAAELADLHARFRDTLLAAGATPVEVDDAPRLLGRTRASEGTVRSTVYNTFAFQTPIAELDLTTVSKHEAQAYERWREGYERNWTNFDPVGVRFTLQPDRMAVDVTVMPLILRSGYTDFAALSGGTTISDTSGDRHDDALLHVAVTLDPNSEEFRRQTSWLASLGSKMVQPLGWLGDAFTIYVDPAPEFFADLMKARDDDWTFFAKNLHRLPLALHAEVRDPLRLAAFLTALRVQVDETAPDMTRWTTLSHGNQKYVRIGSPSASEMLGTDKEFAIYYVATPDGFLLTLDEALLKRHIDRRTARRAAKDAGDPEPAPKPYLGAHLNGHVALSALEQIRHLDLFDLNPPDLHTLCFANLPILNTWRRLYPDQDPVAVHERLFSVRLVCPAGGRYVWDDTWRTMASTVLGHPAAQRSATVPLLEGWRRLRFGITFEHDGLRARVEMTKQ